MGLVTVIFIAFGLLLAISIPHWPHTKNWGYGPFGGVVVIGVLLLFDWWK